MVRGKSRKSFKARAMVEAPGTGQNEERSQVATLQTELKAGEAAPERETEVRGKMENLEGRKSSLSREQRVQGRKPPRNSWKEQLEIVGTRWDTHKVEGTFLKL